MARKAKNVALDRAQEKAKKQKRLAIILCSVLALVLVYEVPKTLKLMSPAAKAPVVEASAATPPAPNPTVTTATPAAGSAALPPTAAQTSAPAQSIVASVQVQPDPGQLTEFARFASKDPFLQSVQKSGAAAATASGSPSSKSAAPPKTKTVAPPKTPPAPPPTTAIISINGQLVSVTVGTDFGTALGQAGAPLFHLVSLTQKSAKVAIAGGSYADGAPALTLTVGTPVTLQNTADGTRYTLLLEPQGTQLPASTTPTSTTPATTSVVPSSGG
jgi:hypothetical protein